MQTHLLNLSKGQVLEVVTEGNPQDKALVLHHGAFGSCENMAPFFQEVLKRNFFVIGITRPGYAGSTRREGRRAHNYHLETEAVINHFQVHEYVSLGWSSGSPAALSDLQDYRCRGAVTVSGDAPRVSDDWQSYVLKYPPHNDSTEDFQFPSFDELRKCKTDELVQLFGSTLSKKDVEVCGTNASEYLSMSIHHGMASGDFGALDDLESDAAPWGIELEKISKPVAIFQGGEDRMCIPAHGYFLSEKIPNAQLFLEPEEGHISLMYNKSVKIIDKALEILES